VPEAKFFFAFRAQNGALKVGVKSFAPHLKKPPYFSSSIFCSLVTLSQDWFPTVQLVLQADWQVLLHSPQPVVHLFTGFAIVLIITNYLQ